MSETTETRPRRTLADVVANPPEGWTATYAGGVVASFHWRRAPGENWLVRIAYRLADRACEAPEYYSRDLAVVAAAHRAAADLLDLLAEVSDV